MEASTLLGVKPFQYQSILVSPLNGLYVSGDVLIMSWDRINKKTPGQAVSLGVYNDKCGIEWSIDSHDYVQIFVKCPVENEKAAAHWIFDYVVKDSERRFLPSQRLKFKELAGKGEYRTIFDHLKTLLSDFENGVTL